MMTISDLLEASGLSKTGLARMLGTSRQTIQQWRRRIPAERVLAIEEATGVSRSKIRPDLYPPRKRNSK